MPYRSVPLHPADCSFVIIEDNPLVSDLLSFALREKFQPRAIKVFTHGRAGVEYCREHKPQLVIADLGLPDVNGRAVIRMLITASPATRVLVLTAEGNATLPAELVSLGVSGYVDKATPLAEIELAIRRVLAGGIHFSAGVRPVPAQAPVNGVHEKADVPPEALSEREREVARMVASGMISKQIGERIGLSHRTVEKIRARILDKIHVSDVAGLVRWCTKHGLA